MQIHLEKKFSCYVFLCIMEAIEVTQEINSTGIIPLEALRAHLPKRPHNILRVNLFALNQSLMFCKSISIHHFRYLILLCPL